MTKGLKRHNVVISKSLILVVTWTVFYFMCFGITYGYNEYFWDNSIAQSLLLSATLWWVFGLWTVALSVLFSTLFTSGIGVMGGTGAVAFGCYLLSLLPKIGKYFPGAITDGASLVYGVTESADCTVALIVTAVTAVACIVVSVPIFNRKQL